MHIQQLEQKPLVSVLMGTDCQDPDIRQLERSLRSILSQSFSDFEFLICADGSSAGSKGLIRQMARTDQRIRIVPDKGRDSLAAKLNACLEQSKGELIARMDDDDVSRPDRFDKQISFLAGVPEIDFIGSNAELRMDGKSVGVRQLPLRPGIRDFLFVQPFIHPTLMFRREVLIAVNGYSEERRCIKCEDYDLLLRLYEMGFQGANLPECLLEYTTFANGNRRLRDRWNESQTRFCHFQKLGLLPGAFPYVVKPVLVGMLPRRVLRKLKEAHYKNEVR